MNIKQKFTECKDWVKDHKKGIIKVGLFVAGASITFVTCKKIFNNHTNVYELPEEDYGRDCTMKFIVNETQEVLGEVPCTELFAKESIEIQKQFEQQ